MASPAPPPSLICLVCGTYFESRRGLSSHARLHLRQLGVTLSESSGAPIELLYQVIKERDGALPDLPVDPSVAETLPFKKTLQKDATELSNPNDKSKAMRTSEQKDHQGSPARLKESTSSLPPAPPSGLMTAESRASEGSSSSANDQLSPTKPLWAPLETDAPITLDTTDELYVCQLCGSWFESRKGLSNHARSHLRQIGIPDGEAKGSPIDLLYRIMEEEDLKPITTKEMNQFSLKKSCKRPSGLSSPATSPPAKKPKSSDDCVCVLCGEEFESRKGLGSHSRSHLNQLGLVDPLGKASPIDTIQELVISGVLQAAQHPKAAAGLSRAQTQPSSSSSSAKSSPQSSVSKAPKAKKGFRLAVDPLLRKLKPEPVETEVSSQPGGSSSSSSSSSSSLLHKPLGGAVGAKPLDTDPRPPPTVLCDFCGQLFETRKALSCHVRAHLRQLGLSWSIKTSPIALLKEVMVQGVESRRESAPCGSSEKATWSPQSSRRSLDSSLQKGEPDSRPCSSPLDFSMKDKSPSGKSTASHQDASCELCGFDFENRKALASHARAHLRQLGIMEWRTDGATSPIELLSELIRSDPAKVAAIHHRYRMGDLYIKKSHRSTASPSDSVSGSGPQKTHKDTSGGTAGSSRQSHGHARSAAAPSVHTFRGVHPPKHVTPSRRENQDGTQQPSRSGSIPAMLPKPPLTQLVKVVGKVYSLKCRFCEEVFRGPLSVQEQWIAHLQKHILSLGYKGKASPPAATVETPALVPPVAV